MKKKLRIILCAAVALLMLAVFTVIGVMASESAPALTIEAANVSFEGTVHLYYAVSGDNIDSLDEVKLLVWKDGQIEHVDECTLENAKVVLSPSGNVSIGEEKCKTFDYDGLAAAEMTEYVYVRAYAMDGEEIVYSPVVKYSILQYSLNMLGITGKGADSDSLKYMLEKMLEYGAAAQMHFAPDAERPLPGVNFVKIKSEGGTFADGSDTSLVEIGEKFTVYAKTTSELPYVAWKNSSGVQVGGDAALTLKASSNMTYSATLSKNENSFGKYERVFIIGVDGAGAFDTSTPNIDTIFADGSVTKRMRVTSPTSSAASWASMFHGSLPTQNGVYENGPVENPDATYPMDSAFPSIFKQVKELDPEAKVAVYSGWSGITNGILEDDNLAGFPQTRQNDAQNYSDIKNYIKENNDFKLLFWQINEPDAMGHNNGYTSDAYYNSIQKIDTWIGDVYNTLQSEGLLESTLFVVTADHGGTPDGKHGMLSDAEKYVLFAVAGHTVENAGAVDMQSRDVASIALYALGVPQPESYTSRVPSGIFRGVEAGERPEFHDPANYRDPIPSATPEYNGDGFITEKIDKSLMVYLPFDGNIDELAGNRDTEFYDTISYESGYFGEGVVLDDGYVEMQDFAPGTESFTVSMWVKTPAPDGLANVVASKSRANIRTPGFVLAMRRDTSTGKALFAAEHNVGGDGYYLENYNPGTKVYLPEDFYRGWMHITFIVDRENKTVTYSFDFGEFTVYDYSSRMLDDTFTNSEFGTLVFGQDASGSYKSTMGLTIDEFMIFNGALDRDDVNALAHYYGKEGIKTIKDVLGENPSFYLDFENNFKNHGTDSLVTSGSVDYVDSPFGTGADFSGAAGNSNNNTMPEQYVHALDYKLSKEQEGGGYNSNTFSFWLKLDDDTTIDRVIFSTNNNSSTNRSDGIMLLLYQSPKKVTEADFPSSLDKSLFIFDESDDPSQRYARYADTGDYLYRQLLLCRMHKITDDNNYIESSMGFYMYASLNEWSHLVFVVDRGEYGADDGVAKMYQNNQPLYSHANASITAVPINDSKKGTPEASGVNVIEDELSFNGTGLKINDDEGRYPRAMMSHLDEFMVFDKALTDEDVEKLYEYYLEKME